MKTTITLPMSAAISAAIGITLPNTAAITVDGALDGTGYGAPLCVQTTPTSWGNENFLANLYAVRSAADTIHLMIGGEVSYSNTILLFIDSKPGGVTFIPNNLITSGGEEAYINTGFNPSLNTSTPDALSSIRTAVEFCFNAATDVSYRIEVSTDLSEWNTIETDIIGESAVVTRFYSIENQPKRYFRARRN